MYVDQFINVLYTTYLYLLLKLHSFVMFSFTK